MISRTPLALVILFSATTNAVAATDSDASDPMATVYASDVTVQNENTKEVTTLKFQPNRMVLVRGNLGGRAASVGGLWGYNIDNSLVCIQPSPLGGVTIPGGIKCLPLTGHASNEKWSTTNDSDQTLNLTLTPSQTDTSASQDASASQ